jgi:hypothetical protein
LCEKKCAAMQAFLQHGDDTGERPFECAFCSNIFTYLSTHVIKMHRVYRVKSSRYGKLGILL